MSASSITPAASTSIHSVGATDHANGAAARRFTATTRALLACGALAGPLWTVVSLAQAATRNGFDLTRHPLSALSNGSLGWLQIANFLVAGLLTTAGATGLRRVRDGIAPGRWLPRLVLVSGLGMASSGVFVMDPADGFPVGTPSGMPDTMSWHSYAHMAAGSITFIALIAACYLLGGAYRRTGRRGPAAASRIAGTALLLGQAWAMTGGTGGALTLAVGAISSMLWVSGVTFTQRRSA